MAGTLAFVVAAVFAAQSLTGQGADERDDAAVVALEARIAALDTPYTDWVLLRDVCDKLPRFGTGAVPVLQKAIKSARDRDDPRYCLRLLGALARIDGSGVEQLRGFLRDERASTAAIAARILGRCGAESQAARRAFVEALEDEDRPWVASAIAMGAADMGAVEVAPGIQARLQGGELEPEVARWFAVALARLSKDTPADRVVEWLQSSGPMADAGTLAARWLRHPPLEVLLLERAESSDGVAWKWTVESLGACGGDGSRAALRESLDASVDEQQGPPGSVVLARSDVDPRLLALARLGEAAALDWLVKSISADGRSNTGGGRPSFEVLTPENARLAELLGKWRCPNSSDLLRARLRAGEGSATSRAYAARGLCWQHEADGLAAAADLLVTPKLRAVERGMGMALALAQETLHEFVANADRPDYVIVGDDEAAAAKVGAQWQTWLKATRDSIEWRDPIPGDDMVLWR